MSADDAARYCAGQAAQLLGELGLRAVETWGTTAYASGPRGLGARRGEVA
jgi:hypothetical protein